MYEKYYGLKAAPFQTNPNPALYFASRQHRRAMRFLEYGLHRNEGFIVVTGEIGAGKTTVISSLLRRLDPNRHAIAHLVSTQLDADNALRMVAAAFGLNATDKTKADLLLAIEGHLRREFRSGKRCLLIVDEVQNLSVQAVEELRMLSNFQQDAHTLLQSFLVGQPEFRDMLQSASLTQLRQRVTASCHIGSLDAEDTQAYIRYRLSLCGWNGSPHFDDVYATIHACTGGIPRRINALCDRLLLSGYLSEQKSFTAHDVEEVAQELESETMLGPLTRAPSDTARDAASAAPAAGQGDPALAQLQLAQLEARMARMEAALDEQRQHNLRSLELMALIASHLGALQPCGARRRRIGPTRPGVGKS